ncbi:glycosyltransferase family 4 protein [Pseudomonas aeruginosa PA99]|nr:glycosyltransferase family 4 protein [Pseudomonas aeruginosa PA99]
MTRLLVECTYVFEHPKVNSGIQRVVRNVIRELPEADETVECIPVAMLDGTLYQVHSLAPLDPRPHSPLVRLRILVERAANYFWLGQRTLEKRRPFRSSPWARRLLYVACRLFAFAFLSIPLRLLDRILGKQQPAPVRATPLEHRAGDQLVLLDSSWHADFFPLAERLKSEGVGIVSVIYDLIPLTHPQFCDAGLVKVFNHWFDWIAATADGYVAISETIRDEVRAEMLRRIGPEKVAQRWFDYFHLGSELDLVEDGASVEPDLLRMFKAKAPVFLMVSTIEPRKNHGYLLDAFERAWAQGSQVRLCIAGRIGWKCEALVERVRQHPELNKRLFMFNDLSDKSLEYAYSHAASLVFPSYVEGFGLPLVEAMQRGLPAMGSDIPVFREIGGEFMAYFDLADPQTLANLVTRFEATGEFPAERPVGEWRWIGWHEASRQLIARILLALGKARRMARQYMRIAVNARILQAPRTGIGHYLVELLGALQAHADFEFSLFHGWGWSGDLPAAALPGYSRLSPWLRNLPGAYRARRWLEQRRFDSGRPPVDLYHEPSLWPLDFDGPMLMTLHDLTHLHYPATQPAARLREIERRLARGMEKARLILTDSQAIADEAQAYFGLPRERFVVAPLGHAARFRPRDRESLREPLRAHGLVPRGYFLCVGTLEPRKNLSLALRAHGQLPAAVRQRFPLMIVGMPGWESRSLDDELRQALASGTVRLLGYLPDERVAELMSGARALVFPSIYEGFGLPVLEAMASGTPVLLTRLSAMPEVAGEAGSYIDPDDANGLSDMLVRMTEDTVYWECCREAGLRRAEQFSWKRCANLTAAAYRRAVEG